VSQCLDLSSGLFRNPDTLFLCTIPASALGVNVAGNSVDWTAGGAGADSSVTSGSQLIVDITSATDTANAEISESEVSSDDEVSVIWAPDNGDTSQTLATSETP